MLSTTQDGPPKAKLAESHPILYRDFVSAIPVPDYMRYDGIFNLSAHFPTNSAVQPDLGICLPPSSALILAWSHPLTGPKVYMALASSQRDGYSGSTRLHCDLCDAVNVMVYSEPPSGTALWHIFRASDAPVIRQFIRAVFHCVSDDPIYSQLFYLGPSHLSQLRVLHGVIPFEIHQAVGEAIFIPAGCPHQVIVPSSQLCQLIVNIF
jgi:hypothetical protein